MLYGISEWNGLNYLSISTTRSKNLILQSFSKTWEQHINMLVIYYFFKKHYIFQTLALVVIRAAQYGKIFNWFDLIWFKK